MPTLSRCLVLAVALLMGTHAAAQAPPPPPPEPGAWVRVTWTDASGEERTQEGRLVSSVGGRLVVAGDAAAPPVEVGVARVTRMQVRNEGSNVAFVGGFLAGAILGGLVAPDSDDRQLQNHLWYSLIGGGLGGVGLSRVARRRPWIDTRLPAGAGAFGVAPTPDPNVAAPGPPSVVRLRAPWPAATTFTPRGRTASAVRR